MKNRKKTETYRFNGLWGMRPVKTDDLQDWIKKAEAKLANPEDPDDKKWTARWLRRFRQELKKKLRGKEQKKGERNR